MKVIADTNVYISALNFGGVSDQVLSLGRAHLVSMFVSPSILQEIEGVLIRKFHWSHRRAQKAIKNIQGFAYLVFPKEKIELIKEDESDNRILECALEAKAQIIITGDKHLQRLRKFCDIAILNPREFLELVGQRPWCSVNFGLTGFW